MIQRIMMVYIKSNFLSNFLIYIKEYILKIKDVIMMTQTHDFWKLTSIKVLAELYKDFRKSSKLENMTLQKLVNRSMYLFLNDPDFKSTIKDVNELKENYKKGY